MINLEPCQTDGMPIGIDSGYISDFDEEKTRTAFDSIINDSYRLNAIPQPKVVGYESEDLRYQSFVQGNWQAESIVKASELAHTGLYYTGTKDRVKCVYCLGVLYNWDIGDDPMIEHTKHFPACPFLHHIVQVTLANRIQLSSVSGAVSDNKYSRTYVEENWENIPSVDIVKRLGFSEHILRTAKPHLFNSFTDKIQTNFSNILLDIVFQIETELRQSEERRKIESRELLEQSSQGATSISSNTRDNYNHDSTVTSPNLTVSSVPSVPYPDPGVVGTKPKTQPKSEPKRISQHPELKKLVEENQKLKDNTFCGTCHSREANILFLPCRHIVSCDICSTDIKNCTKCEKEVIGTIKIYMG